MLFLTKHFYFLTQESLKIQNKETSLVKNVRVLIFNFLMYSQKVNSTLNCLKSI
jgi:hypothetical protein